MPSPVPKKASIAVAVFLALGAVALLSTGIWARFRDRGAVTSLPLPSSPTATPDPAEAEREQKLASLQDESLCANLTTVPLKGVNPSLLVGATGSLRWLEASTIPPDSTQAPGIWKLGWFYWCKHRVVTLESQLAHQIVAGIDLGETEAPDKWGGASPGKRWTTQTWVSCFPTPLAEERPAGESGGVLPTTPSGVVATGVNVPPMWSSRTRLRDGVPPQQIWIADTVGENFRPLKPAEWRCLRTEPEDPDNVD